jgi:2-polyprenyl-6-methoxyphenol hydroxylase-like FAD-dependent oxidoreductase
LNARGWRTTVVERAPRLRDEGQNIDIRGAAREVARRMGIEDTVRAAGTGELGLRFVDDDGAAVAEFPAGDNDTDGGTAELEILRGELARVLYERTADRTEYRFGEQIRHLSDHGDHVTATLASGDTVDADVVVVAEGTRSRTRATIMPEAGLTELGLCLAYLTIPRTPDDDRWWRWHHTTGSRSVGLRPDNRGTTAAPRPRRRRTRLGAPRPPRRPVRQPTGRRHRTPGPPRRDGPRRDVTPGAAAPLRCGPRR